MKILFFILIFSFNLQAAKANESAKGCSEANLQQCEMQAGHDYFTGKIAQAREKFEFLCKRKNLNACHFIGEIESANENIENALKYYSIGCKGGLERSCPKAFIYTKRMQTFSTDFLVKLCNSKDFKSCHDLGYTKVQNGEYKKALQFFNQGCVGNFASSCYEVGNDFEIKGKKEEANKFYERSCVLGNCEVCKLINKPCSKPKQ